MIYIDTFIAPAHLLVEDRQPLGSLWEEPLSSSKLLEYEIWMPLNARCGRQPTSKQRPERR